MASGTAVKTSGLIVLQPDQFEGEAFVQEDVHRIQASYYKGAPPQWVNFFLAERSRTPFVKRDGYEEMRRLIETQRKKRRTVTKVNLLHQPGSGGSTLAMQVLWDLRKAFQCAKVEDIVTDSNAIAKDVINLAIISKQNEGKPVLLLLDNADKLKENFVQTLQKRLIDELNDVKSLHVVILNCVRKVQLTKRIQKQHKSTLLKAKRKQTNKVLLKAKSKQTNRVLLKAKRKQTNRVLLKSKLQKGERGKFDQHHRIVTNQFGNEHNMFHGFNIIRGDFRSENTADVCNVKLPPETETRDQLFAILALVNTYAPGSDLLLDQCEMFLQNGKHSTHGPPKFKDQMGSFSDLLVKYTNFEKNTDYVRIAHPMIATKCVQLFRKHCLSLGEVTRLFLQKFCANTESPRLLQTTKSMLTMREMEGKNEEKEKYPKLIQDILEDEKVHKKEGKLIQHISEDEKVYEKEGKQMCRGLLKEASNIFQEQPIFPQALARCYYLMVDKCRPIHGNDYSEAEKWAKEAIKRHPNNSFIMDTLGQAHKHHLFHYVKTGEKKCQSEVLRLGLLAINAFQKEERAAEMEEAEESENEATANFSSTFNTRGKLGYLQVADKLFQSLLKFNSDWQGVLTGSRMIQESLAVQLTRESRNLTINLKAQVKKRFEFFEQYLTYSKPYSKDDPNYIRECVNKCYAKYVRTPPRVLKIMRNEDEVEDEDEDEDENEDEDDEDEVEDETEEDVIVTLTDLQDFLRRGNFSHYPEFYHLALLQDVKGLNPSVVVMKMRESYNNMYKKYFRSRYLVPLYMRSTEDWQTLSELSLKPWEIEKGTRNDAKDTEDEADSDQRNIEERLLHLVRVQGRIQRSKVFIENSKIEAEPHNKENVLEDGVISFYLGFNIRGPVAFNIKYKKH